MEVNAVDAATKAVPAAKKPSPAAAKPSSPGNLRSTVNSPVRQGDFVTLSRTSELSLQQANRVAGPSSAAERNEPRAASPGLAQANTQRKLSVTDDRQVILKIIDPTTKDVVKQVPTEAQVKLREAVRNLVDNLSPQEPPAK